MCGCVCFVCILKIQFPKARKGKQQMCWSKFDGDHNHSGQGSWTFQFRVQYLTSDSENSHCGTGVSHVQQKFYINVQILLSWQFMGISPNMMYSRSTGFLKFNGSFLVLLSKRYFIQSLMGFLFSTLLQLFDLWRDLSEFLHSLYISLSLYIYICIYECKRMTFQSSTHTQYTYVIVYIHISRCSRHDIGLSHLISVF